MHTIRLRKPWQRFCDDASPPERVDVPDSQPATVKQVVRYERAFNCPTGIAAADRVQLVVSDWQGSLHKVQLNGNTVVEEQIQSQTKPLRIDLTDHLQPNNRVSISIIHYGDSKACLSGTVNLQILSG